MLLLLELAPLALNLMVCLKFGVTLHINNAKRHEVVKHLVEDEREDTCSDTRA